MLKHCHWSWISTGKLLPALTFTLGLFALPGRADTIDVFVETADGWRCIPAELADNPEARRRGLSGRHALPPDTAMLFWWSRIRPLAMWMKDTHVSLDMIFIDRRFEVGGVAAHTEPLSLKVIEFGRGWAVLELVAGRGAELGIKAGQAVRFDLPGAPAPPSAAMPACLRQSRSAIP